MLEDPDDVVSLMDQFLDPPMKPKAKYAFSSQGSYFGYKVKGREVMDDQEAKYYNEINNVTWPSDHIHLSSV